MDKQSPQQPKPEPQPHDKGRKRWLVGVVIALIAAGGGGTAWLSYFFSSEPEKQLADPWQSAQAEFFESFDLNYENTELWPIGNDGVWDRQISEGKYCFTNTDGDGLVDYQYMSVTDMDNSNLPVAITLDLAQLDGSQPHSGAGLLYRYDESSQFYYAVILTIQGQLNIYKRNQQGYNTLYSGPATGIKQNQNRLAVVADGPRFGIYLNQALVRTIEDKELAKGSGGFVGIGIGHYCFDNFAIYRPIAQLRP